MKKYDFDKVVERKGSGAIKMDCVKKVFGKDGLIPMWVADMDFETPDFIVRALKQRLEHPVFGYTAEPEDFRPAIADWIEEHHGWKIEREWLSYIPGIVKGIGMVINALLEKDDKVIIQPPVYHPFRLVPQKNGREVVFNPIRELPDGGYEMDFENLEAVCDDKCKLLILSNPHNPAGIVWPRETLVRLADFCYRKGLIVISDEIHCDMALFGNQHVPFASVSDEAAACSITFGAPSKTFNIAGIVSSYCIVPNESLRQRFYSWMEASEFNAAPIFAPIATIAAYRKGEEWRKQMIRYIEDNIDFVISFCRERIPQIKPLRPQASFLIWLDCRDLGLGHEELVSLFVDKAGLALNDGETFNPGGEGFMRLNIGTSRIVLQDALERLERAINPCIDDKPSSDMLFVINPIAGNSKKTSIVSKLEKAGYKLVFAEYPGHAEEIARQAEEDIIVAVGGDGTVNEVARGILETEKTLGIIPCGSGDGLALHLGISRVFAKALDTVLNGTVHRMDVGKINGKPFFSVCGVGFDAVVSKRFAKSGTRGVANYIQQGLTAMKEYVPEKYSITVDGNSWECDAVLITVGNSSQWGNGAKIAPLADTSDGLLDVTVADKFTLPEVPALACRLMIGSLDKSERVHCYQGKNIMISRQSEGPAHADGDWFETGREVDINIIPSAIKVLVPNK